MGDDGSLVSPAMVGVIFLMFRFGLSLEVDVRGVFLWLAVMAGRN